jgi:hypothetical protein
VIQLILIKITRNVNEFYKDSLEFDIHNIKGFWRFLNYNLQYSTTVLYGTKCNVHCTILYRIKTKSKQITSQRNICVSTFTLDSHQNTLLECARKTRTPPYLTSPSKSHGKLHGSRKTPSDPSPTETQQSRTTK